MSGRLGRLLRPRSLAFIGGGEAELAIDACRSMGFAGEMWAVNPRRSLRGLPTFSSARGLPAAPDAAFVGVSSAATIDAVRELAARGAGAAVCYASGFAETGAAGAALQRELLEAAAGLPLLGPNCYGTLSALTGAALWPDVHGLVRRDRGVALLSQSGNVAVNLTMQRRSLDVAHVMALGNQADVGLAEALEAMAEDDAVTGIGLFIEAVDDVSRFKAAAGKARARRLPVVALKVGASHASGAIALTHTASLVGSDAAYAALFERLGIRRVETVGELLDTLSVLVAMGPLRGNRVVSLSCSGGEAALVADRSRGRGLVFAPFEPARRARVATALDGRVTVSNPLDYQTFIWGDQARLLECFTTVLQREPDSSPCSERGLGGDYAPHRGGPPFDAAMLVLDFPARGLDWSRWWPTLDAFAAACHAAATAGLVVASMPENLPEQVRNRARELGLASCAGIDNALRALEAAAGVQPEPGLPGPGGKRLAAGSETSTGAPADIASGRVRDPRAGLEPTAAPAPPSREQDHGAVALSEHESKQRLADSGILVPQSRLVTVSGAADAAREIGFPVVVKATGLAHKSERAGVTVGLTSAAEVVAAAERVAARAPALADAAPVAPAPRLVLVESHVSEAVAELLVHARAELPIGTLVTVGAGGVLVELIDDVARLLLPVTPEEILAALRRLRVWPLLSGFRGRPPADVDAVVEAVTNLARLISEDDAIVEAEINPLLATPHSAVAVDGLIVVEAPTGMADGADAPS